MKILVIYFPATLSYSKDVVAAAKVTNEFSKNNENLVIIGGALKEKVLDIDGIKHHISSLPELQAKILGLISTPAKTNCNCCGNTCNSINNCYQSI